MTIAATPGEYIRRCRSVAGLSIDDIALRVETDPPVGASRRAEWLVAIEQGLLPVRITTAAALHAIPELRIHLPVLAKLIEDEAGETMMIRFRPAPILADAHSAPQDPA